MLSVFLSISLSIFCSSVRAQETESKAVVPDAVMQNIVSRIVRSYFKPTSKARTVYISDRLIRKEWLPAIKKVNFVVLDTAAVLERQESVYFFKETGSEGESSIGFGYGWPHCKAFGDIWLFRTIGSRLRLSPVRGGWASDCGPPSHGTRRVAH